MTSGPDPVRIRLDLAYDGTDFSGWAAQPRRRTIEGTLSEALTTVLRAPDPVRLTVAGRTDAGVHARGQVAHADVDPALWAAVPGRSDRSPAESTTTRLNGILPADIVARAVTVPPAGFDARFSATSRRYLYRMCDNPTRLDPLRRRDTVVVKAPLDVEAMNEAAARLLGLNDFAAFCRRREGATTVRTLLEYSWERLSDDAIAGTVVADAFCHSMVRSLVGAVIPVGLGREQPAFAYQLMTRGRRDPRARVMPPHGLSLENVGYPADDAELAARAEATRTRRSL